MLPKTLCRLGKPGNRREIPLLLPCPSSTWTLLLVGLAPCVYTHIYKWHTADMPPQTLP